MDIRAFFKGLFETNIKFRIKQEKIKHDEHVVFKLNSPNFVDPVDKIERGEDGNYQVS